MRLAIHTLGETELMTFGYGVFYYSERLPAPGFEHLLRKFDRFDDAQECVAEIQQGMLSVADVAGWLPRADREAIRDTPEEAFLNVRYSRRNYPKQSGRAVRLGQPRRARRQKATD